MDKSIARKNYDAAGSLLNMRRLVKAITLVKVADLSYVLLYSAALLASSDGAFKVASSSGLK